MTTPALLNQLKQYVSAEAYRQLAPDDLWLRFRDALDETAFRVLLERLGPRVFARCRALLRDEHLAEEAFQDTFRDLIRKRDRIPTYSKAAAWAYQAATNHARHLRRKRWRWVSDNPPEPVAVPRSSDDAEAVGRLLAELPDRYRRPLELRFWDGLTHAEIAAVLGCPKGTVDKNVARGLERLRAAAGKAGLASAWAVAVEATLARPVVALSEAVLANVLGKLWPEGGPVVAVGPWWTTNWTKAAVALAALGTAAGGVWWATAGRPPEPPAEPPVAVAEPVETLQAKNLRVLHAEVLPRVVAKVQEWVPGNPVRVVHARAFGSEVDILLATDKPAFIGWQGRSGLRLRYCVERRRLVAWDNTQGIDDPRGWLILDQDRPYIDRVHPLGFRFEFSFGKEAFAAIPRLFEDLPRDEQARGEMLRHMFGPHGGVVEDIPVMAPAYSAAGNADYHWVLTHRWNHLFCRRHTEDEWRFWGDVEYGIIAASDTHLYFGRGADIWSRPIHDPTAPEVKVATPPVGDSVRCMTIAAGRLVVRFSNRDGMWVRPLANSAAGWTHYFRGVGFCGVAAVGSRVYTTTRRVTAARPDSRERLVFYDLDAREAGPIDAGPAWDMSKLSALAVWGDRLVYVHDDGRLWTRPLDAGPQVEWSPMELHTDSRKR